MSSVAARVVCRRSLPVLIAVAIASSWPSARADWCETAPGSGIYTNQGCNKPQEYEIRQGARKPAAAEYGKPPVGETLRDKLRRAMKEREAQSAQADKIAGRITEAQNRAKDALRRGSEATDPETRANARLDFTKAMKDLTKAYADADALMLPDRKADWMQLKQEAIANLQEQSEQAFGGSATAASQKEARVQSPDVFEHCEKEATRTGIITCYQAPRRGLDCTMMHKQGGDVIWSENQQPCKNMRMLEMRNTYFNRLEAGRRREDGAVSGSTVANLSPKCRAELASLLDSARKSDGGRAQAAYTALRAECDEAIRKLARDANTRLPERRLSARARDALAHAMSREALPSRGASSGSDNKDGNLRAQGAYDADEVIGLGLDLLALLNGVARAQAGRAVQNVATPPTAQPKPAYGQGSPAPQYRAPRASPSDITGTK